MDLHPVQPLRSAWDDFISVGNQGMEYSMLMTALQTKMSGVGRDVSPSDDPSDFSVHLPAYIPQEVRPQQSDDDFNPQATCLAQLSSAEERENSTEGYCVFLYDVRLNLRCPCSGGWRLTCDIANSGRDALYEHPVEASVGADERCSTARTWAFYRFPSSPLLYACLSPHGCK